MPAVLRQPPAHRPLDNRHTQPGPPTIGDTDKSPKVVHAARSTDDPLLCAHPLATTLSGLQSPDHSWLDIATLDHKPAVTVVTVFAIQRTRRREQLVFQRKAGPRPTIG